MNNLLRLVYVSTSTNPADETTINKDVGRILMQSRKNNPRQKIGGVLYFSNNFFFQCLEGEQQAVNNLYKKISTDPRHNNIQSISVKRISQRQFANWSMKYVALQDNVSRLLQANGMTEFNPYDFDEKMIEQMLGLFTTEEDPSAQPDQDYDNQVDDKKKTGLLSRLFNRNRAA